MKKILLSLIIIFAFVIRIWSVNDNPPGLSWDEVSIGYNAYSIWKTGMDEHGRWMPLDTFIAYGDYKPPLMIYLTVPFVALLGLSEMALRMPSVLAGTISVFLTYLVVLRLGRFAGKGSILAREEMAIVATTLMAISPWSVMLSRGGFEANVGGMLIILGMYLLLKTQENLRYLFISVVPFVLSMYTFNSARYISPILFIGGGYILGFIKKQNMRIFVRAGIFFVLLIIPLLPHLFSSEARLRYQEVNIFSDQQVVKTANERIAAEGNTLWAKFIHNRRWGYLRSFMGHYLDHLQPDFLFIKGDGNPKFSTQETGQLYLWEAPFLFFGLLAFLTYEWRIAAFLLFWLFLAIFPAAVARETPHALRTVNILPVWQIFIAFGISKFWSWGRGEWWRWGSRIFVSALGIGGVIYFLTFLYKYYPIKYAGEWQYGYKQAIEVVSLIEKDYEEVVMSDVVGRPYMYVAFYKAWDPVDFRSTRVNYFDAAGFYHVTKLGKYRFRGENSGEEIKSGILYVLPPKEVPNGANVREKIYLPNSEKKLVLFDVGI